MQDISKIDPNFSVQTTLNIDGLTFHSIKENAFSLYGVFFENGTYRRIPEQIARTVSEGVHHANTHTAGGRIKFVTNSPFVAIHAKIPAIGRMPQFALTGSAGFDLYVGKKEEFYGVFIPPSGISDSYESVIYFDDRTEREITINFPLFSIVSDVYVGLEETAVVKKSSGYKHKKPSYFTVRPLPKAVARPARGMRM